MATMNDLTDMSNDQLLSGSLEDKINRSLMFLRDNALANQALSEKLDNFIKNTTEKINKQDAAIKTIETNTNATLQLYRKEIDDLKNQQANDHVMSEYQSRKYNLIVHNLREDHGNIGRVTLFLSTE